MILGALGVEDYGIYNVVGGLVAMFGILSGSLSNTISRFLTFALGEGNLDKMKNIFSLSVNIQIILIAVITILMETIGLWFLNSKMVFPDNRLEAANWVYQFSIATFALNLLSVPYNAVIIAHERMSAFAYISIIDVTIKLLIAWVITFNPFDRLVYYGMLIMIAGFINRGLYAVYSKRNFTETVYKFVWDKQLIKDMFSFAGWDLFCNTSFIAREQGGNILINLFFSPNLNASRGIAVQVGYAVKVFSQNFMVAVRPQITKSYAAGDVVSVVKYVFLSTKFSFYLLLLPSVPVIAFTPYILDLWLGQVPECCVNYIRLIIVFGLLETFGMAFRTAVYATGNIKRYNLIIYGLGLLNMPLSYLCLKLGFQSESVFAVQIFISLISIFLRLIIVPKIIRFSAKDFITQILSKAVVVVLVISLPCILFPSIFIVDNLIMFTAYSIAIVIWSCATIYFVGCNKKEKEIVAAYAYKMISKIASKK
ncbi:MAG: lipopolysaccharide biosynthesis protein [Bacteroidales bacterium]|nr:lipopolysaccharide biosynthesis protein [Bacteroidales bacterium]